MTHVQADEIDPAPVHRAQLGLKRERPWIDQLCKNAGWPAWARGHINSRDAAFIWDMLELTKPDTVIEIGVASGVSTATFTLGLHLFSAQHKQPMVHAYDLTRTCYFDPTHAVGAAVQDICPVLADSVNVRTQTTAREAAMDHVPGSVQLAMIDADHRHPAATVDLMALLPVLAPGAWVLLHDIELDHIHQQAGDADIVETGPKQLFDAWPFAKVRELMDNPADSNIGAIQLPASVRDAIDVLVEIADQPVLHQPCEMVR